MTLQKKNKFLFLLSLLILSSCSTQVNQEIFEDGTSTISILTEVEDGVDYCPSFERNLQLYDKSCTQDGNSVSLIGTYYLNSEELELQEKLFSSTYIYDANSLYPLLNSLVSLQTSSKVINSEDELDIQIFLKMPGSVKEHSFSEENENIVFSKTQIDSVRNKEITSKVYHIIPTLIVFSTVCILFITSIFLFKKLRQSKNQLTQQQPIQTQEVNVEEQKCRTYVLQFKQQYSKETLFQGLVNSGIPQDRAQYYINKYL
jgi:hypothetical protein